MRFYSALIGFAMIPATAVLAGSTFAPVYLEFTDNGGVSDATGAHLANTVTYEMHVHNLTGHAINNIVGFDFGSQDGPSPSYYGIPITGVLFNHELGGDTNPNRELESQYPALRYDTYWAIGHQAVTFEPGSVDLVGSDGFINGRFMLSGASYNVADGDYLRFGRITFLDGNFDYFRPFAFDAILADGSRVRFGVPAPGAGAVLGLAGAFGARRRRR